MANNPLYNSSLANLYRTIGQQRGVSPAFVNASIAQGISESSLNPSARGDGGQAQGLHQWHPDRYQQLLALSQKMNLPPTDPRVQINHWYNENQKNLGIADPRAANDAAIGSERPAGWKPGDPTGVPSYNKRLGDTYALMRKAAGQPNPQDPNSFVATASDSTPQVGGEQPQAPQAAQSFSLGDQENQQPLNNIGSTLANMGASIASLDRHGTGIASLNASRVASNLAQQEQQRAAEGGWKYVGQTQNGQGLMFQNSKGEVRVEPLAPGFSGQKEPEAIRTLRMLADPANKNLLDTKQAISGKESNTDENGNWKYSTPVEDIDKKIERVKAGESMQSVMARGNQKSRDDFNHRLTETGVDPVAFSASAAEQAGRLAEFRTFGKDLSTTEQITPKLLADIDIARQRLADYQKANPTGNIVPLNQLLGMSTANLTGPGAKELAQLKTAYKDVLDTHARLLGRGTVTEASRQQSNDLMSPYMAEPVASGVLDALQSHAVRNLDFQRKGYANMGSRMRKEAPAYPELEVDPETKGGAKKQPTISGSAKAPSNIRNPNDLMNWIQSSGLKKGTPFTLPDGSEGIVP